MKWMDKTEFLKQDPFGIGVPNTAYAQFFDGESYLHPLTDPQCGLFAACRVRPMVNQILLHISNTNRALLSFCRAQGIQIEAYSPIAHGVALQNPVIGAMAERYGITAAQLCVRYVLQLGAVALPKTENPGHMAENAAVDFSILQADMDVLETVDKIESYGAFNGFPVFGKSVRGKEQQA